MDLVPKPDQLAAAAANLTHAITRGGFADLRPMPRTPVDGGEHHQVLEYDAVAAPVGDPVLLVPPPTVPSDCFDLRRGCSLVEHLLAAARPTYVLEHGAVSVRDHDLGVELWADEVVPEAVRATSRHAGRRPVHLVGWSLGGTVALLAAAGDAGLPLASLTLLGTPIDLAAVPLVAPARPLLTADDWPAPVARGYRLLSQVVPAVRWTTGLDAVQRLAGRPLAVAGHLDDLDWLAQLEAVERLLAGTAPYRGRSYGRIFHRFSTVGPSLAPITAPTLVVAGATDVIAPVESVRAVLPLLTGSPETRLEIVPGGHLGLLTGRGARTTTWAALAEWFGEHDGRRAPVKKTTKKTTTKPAKKAAPTKAPARAKAAASRSTSDQPVPDQDGIGANPRRRYSSASSRSLTQ